MSIDQEQTGTLELSIVMPCLNEAETLEGCIQEAQRALRQESIYGEVIIADNGSIDGSTEIARALQVRVVDVSVKGYGSALQAGIRASRSTYVLMADADGSYDFSKAGQFLDVLKDGADLVVGNRFQGGIEKGAMPWLHRYLGNPVLSMIGRLFFRAPIGDFHCGLRAFRKDAIQNLRLSCPGMEFASEMIVKACLAGLDVREIPTVLRPDGRSRRPHLRTWRDGWRHLCFMLLYSPNWLFLVPALVLGSWGMCVLLVLMICGPIRIAGVGWSVNTSTIASLCVLTSVQIFTMWRFARTLGRTIGAFPTSQCVNHLAARSPWGIIVGCGCFLVGSAMLLWATVHWQAQAFGDLSPNASVRMVIPGATLTLLGVQLILGSFFLQLLQVFEPLIHASDTPTI